MSTTPQSSLVWGEAFALAAGLRAIPSLPSFGFSSGTPRPERETLDFISHSDEAPDDLISGDFDKEIIDTHNSGETAPSNVKKKGEAF